MNRLFDVRHHWFRPLWVRILLVALILFWTGAEFLRGAHFWALLFGAAGLHLINQFFIVFDPKEYARKDPAGGGAGKDKSDG